MRRGPAARHRRPARRGRLAQRAGLAVAGCGIAATAAGLGGWTLATAGGAARAAGTPAVPPIPVPHGVAARQPGPAGRPHVSRPARLVIPAIGVRTRLVRLGLTSERALQVPATAAVAGWFTRSPRPGATGASIIAGHIDSLSGPGVFFRLARLRRGQAVYVIRADRSLAVFRVTAVRQYPKDRFPAAAVYGPVPDAELRLITCGGTFDYATGEYLSNVVVYAVLVPGQGRPGATGPAAGRTSR